MDVLDNVPKDHSHNMGDSHRGMGASSGPSQLEVDKAQLQAHTEAQQEIAPLENTSPRRKAKTPVPEDFRNNADMPPSGGESQSFVTSIPNPTNTFNARPSIFNPSTEPLLPAPKSTIVFPNNPAKKPCAGSGSESEGRIKIEAVEDDSQTPTEVATQPREHFEPIEPIISPSLQVSRINSEAEANTSAVRTPAASKSQMAKPLSKEVDYDSGDDLEEINIDQATEEARARWSEPRIPISPATPQTTCPLVKNEPVDDESSNPVGRPKNIPVRNQPAPASRPAPRVSTSALPSASSPFRGIVPAIRLGASYKLNTPSTPLNQCLNHRISTTNSSDMNMRSIIAAQQAIVNKKPSQKTGMNDPRQLDDNDMSPGPSTFKKRTFDGKTVAEDPEQVEAAMRGGSHEDSWMYEEYEDELALEIDVLEEKIEKISLRKDRNGILPAIDTLQLLQLRKALSLKKKLQKASKNDSSATHEESLFVSDDRDEMLSRHRRVAKEQAKRVATPDMDLDGEGDGAHANDRERESSQNSERLMLRMLAEELDGEGLGGVPEKEIPKDKRARKKPARDAREVHARAKAKAQKQKSQGKTQKGRKALGKDKGSKKGMAASKGKSVDEALGSRGFKFNRNDGFDEIGDFMINDLINHDPINDRIHNPIFNVGPEPDMPGNHNKQTQLQRLLTNVPEGSDTRQAKDDKKRLLAASRAFGFAQVKAVNGKWKIKGMNSTLYHHQLLGAQWMIEREMSDVPPFGGLLADGMGLGKTVQTLACMVGHPPDKIDIERQCKATLIVVPSSVIDQWMDEIKVHVEAKTFPKVLHYKGSSKISIDILRDLDIVVTSYQEVMRQFPYPDADDREKIARLGFAKWWKQARKGMGTLFDVYWYRVVLDEAHAIKNNQARTSLACQALKSVYRWCLTGTPLLNRLEELFPYLRFLQANYSMDWKTFQRYFCDPAAHDCRSRIATLLSCTMMRRTMKTTMFDRPILTLPKPHPEIRYITFSAEERIIYRITENRFRANLNFFLANGTAGANYTQFLVQLLRLRQCTAHPFMLENTIKECWTSSDLRELKSKLKSISNNPTPFYETCNVWIKQTEEERAAAENRGDDPNIKGVEQGESMRFGASDFGHVFKMEKAIKTVSKKDVYQRLTCPLCSDLPSRPMVTDCGHVFCNDCLLAHMHQQAGNDDDYMTCPICDRIFSTFKPHRDANDPNDGQESDDGTPSSQGNKKKRKTHGNGGKGADALGYEPKVKDSTWVDLTDNDHFPLVPSAKMVALKAILLKGFQEAPTDKVVIYVQFRLMSKIIGRICHAENWGFLYLTGECSLEHRTKAIKKFRDDDDCKILIAGLKCGGLGLNFPWANRCISLDLWWNHAVEQQAFGRIFRIGQMKETHMTRLIVKNTVDMRLLKMQAYKLAACENAVGSGEAKNKPSLSLKELAKLFGFLREKDGEVVEIVEDYEGED